MKSSTDSGVNDIIPDASSVYNNNAATVDTNRVPDFFENHHSAPDSNTYNNCQPPFISNTTASTTSPTGANSNTTQIACNDNATSQCNTNDTTRSNNNNPNVPLEESMINISDIILPEVMINIEFPNPDDPSDDSLDIEAAHNRVNAHYDVESNNAITMDIIQDNIVSPATLQSYLSNSFYFLRYLYGNGTDILTNYYKNIVEDWMRANPGATEQQLFSGNKIEYMNLLRNATNRALFHLDLVTPALIMHFVLTLRNVRGGNYLSRSAYGSRRAALFHLYRCHNRIGFGTEFSLELTNLFRGFFRGLASGEYDGQQPEINGVGQNIIQPNNNREQKWRWNDDKSKLPMSVELLKSLCKWLVQRGDTNDGPFALCYLLLTWNLACRSNNTASIKLGDISWSTHFDCFSIIFAHSKTDQTGNESRYPRHIFANPHDPIVCPVTALALYISTNFSTSDTGNLEKLFPGPKQDQRFGKILMKILKQHEAEVIQMGFQIHNIGSHSIRKGASTYLTSLPGGPPASSSSIRGGWTMGKVKDIYWKYMESGDQFVGRCLALLNIMTTEFGSSPPFFDVIPNSDVDDLINEQVFLQFAAHCQFPGFGRMCRMLLCSIVLHHRWINVMFNLNHCVIKCSTILTQALTMNKFYDNETNSFYFIKVAYPWNDQGRHIFTGIPPHVSLLQEVTSLRDGQRLLINTFVDRVKEALTQFGVNSGHLTEERFRAVLDNFRNEFVLRDNAEGRARGNAVDVVNGVAQERIETGEGYKLHTYMGSFHRVPIDWRPPRHGVKALWHSWWIGDTDRGIPPLKRLDINDLKHLDKIPLSDRERHRRPGRYGEQRRSMTKQLCDMRFLMNYMTELLVMKGKLAEVITQTTVEQMFKEIQGLIVKERDVQKQWMTVCNEVRKRKRLGTAY